MSKSVAYKHFLRALSRFPKDPLRPELQFQDVIRRRIDKTFSITAAPAKPESRAKNVSEQRQIPVIPLNEERELGQVNALYSLLEGRYAKKYPIANSLMEPKSNPTYYKDLIRELETAPERSFWQRMTSRWKGLVRFQ